MLFGRRNKYDLAMFYLVGVLLWAFLQEKILARTLLIISGVLLTPHLIRLRGQQENIFLGIGFALFLVNPAFSLNFRLVQGGIAFLLYQSSRKIRSIPRWINSQYVVRKFMVSNKERSLCYDQYTCTYSFGKRNELGFTKDVVGYRNERIVILDKTAVKYKWKDSQKQRVFSFGREKFKKVISTHPKTVDDVILAVI